MAEGQDLNITFSGCGFLGIYHLGVVSCLKENAPDLLKRVKCFGGASAGALAAAGLMLDINLTDSADYVLRLAKRANSLILGPLHPNFHVVRTIRRSFERSLPENAHELASGRLHISLTRVSDLKNVIVSEFYSKEDLIEALVASSFVPFYSGILPATFRGKYYIDGGISDNLPQHFTEGETITVSPWSGESDICPKENCSNDIHIHLKNTSVQFTLQNLYRCSRAFFPPPKDVLVQMCKDGHRDTLRFLKTHYPDMLLKEAARKASMQVFGPTGGDYYVPRLSSSTTVSVYSTCSCGDSETQFYSSETSCTCSCASGDEMAQQEDVEMGGEKKLMTMLSQRSEAVTEAELWSCYIIKRILWVIRLPTRPLVLSVRQISYLAEVIVKVLPKVEKTGNSFLDRLLASIYMVVYTYQDWHTPSLRKKSQNVALEESKENVLQHWQHCSSSIQSSYEDLSVFSSESQVSSDIEVIGTMSDENLVEMFTHMFASQSESDQTLDVLGQDGQGSITSTDKRDDAAEACVLDQWEDVNACYDGCHMMNDTVDADYVFLEGCESDVEELKIS